MADETKTEAGEQEQPKPTEAVEKTGTAPEQKPEAKPAAQSKPITFASEDDFQARVDAILKDRLDRQKRQADEREAKARKEAEEKTLAEQGEFRKLAEARAAELADVTKKLEELEGVKKENARLSRALAEQIAAQTKELPDYLLTLLADKDPVSQMEWITANREKLAPKAAPPNLNGSARGTGPSKLDDKQARELAAIYGVKAEYLPK